MLPAKSRKESGVLRTSNVLGGRPAAAVLLCGALLIVPLLLIHGDPVTSATAATKPPALHADPRTPHHQPSGRKAASRTKSSTPGVSTSGATTTATAAAPVAATVQPPEQAVATGEPVVRRVPDPTTTTVAPTTTTTAPPAMAAPLGADHFGEVTYYDHPAGTCASPWLPFGTVVEVTNPANGYSVSCVVNDREADTARSIDLATATFAALAPLSQGVIDAQLRW